MTDVRRADLSKDGLFRYSLTRVWDHDEIAMATFVMLNPSTADALTDDPTIRRCAGFARSWGCSGMHVVNLYALRAHQPKRLWEAEDPVGPENDMYLADYATRAWSFGWPLIAAWGVNAKPERVNWVLTLPGMGRLEALGTTKNGSPKHPLYLRADSARAKWPAA